VRENAFASIGFLVAAAIPAAALTASGLFWGPFGTENAVGLFCVLYVYSAMLTILIGLPAFFLFRPFRPGHWWSVSMTGLFLGILTSVILRLPGDPDPHDFILFGPVGAATVFVFWLIWRRSFVRPEPNSQ
jgi:hypothetical protein